MSQPATMAATNNSIRCPFSSPRIPRAARIQAMMATEKPATTASLAASHTKITISTASASTTGNSDMPATASRWAKSGAGSAKSAKSISTVIRNGMDRRAMPANSHTITPAMASNSHWATCCDRANAAITGRKSIAPMIRRPVTDDVFPDIWASG